MATTNSTESGNHKTIEELVCSTEVTAGTHNQLIFILVLNVFLSITAILGNTLILAALHKNTFLHSPSKLLYRTLATTDLCVGIIQFPLQLTFWTSVITERWNICQYTYVGCRITSGILCGVSLLTMTAISLDRLLALLLGLRYRQFVTLKRTYLTVTIFWVVCTICSMLYLFNYQITLWYRYIGVSLCLITSSCSYTKIFLILRRRQIIVRNQVHHEQPSQAIPLNIARFRKAVSSALWVQLVLVVCYMPTGIMGPLSPQRGIHSSAYIVRQFTATLVFLNSSLNPMLYCWKMKAVRHAVKETVRQFCCSSS